MKKFLTLWALSTILCSSLSYAGGLIKSDASCSALAKACKSAGYTRGGEMKFWQACMRPVLLGQTVKNVTTDPNQVKDCRDKKIAELQQQLTELQNVK
ncbi:hypothetical protein [Legionella sp. km772]|uniref:hypothetical protein n=1 Tax=Legionella sp. km772 TaxID=2498111 RepID=UPI000F8DCD20|nr:hypothetical protein [Legionella sp. km772]RUR04481.1 hypothetical protein ELY15_15455 [Legionella sp. km772]